MWKDPIIEEIRKRREEHAEKYNYDIQAIVKALKEEEYLSNRKFVSFAPPTGTFAEYRNSAVNDGVEKRLAG